ncbi:unnamed protein product [Bursaphelenchus okinawaensis]|uniref:Tetraspanin n=1 Tax=Bursaphelenchus okinawaensis TaxID=465554 RepID=A0A811LIE5_9BILA|nr:unnamed protein product [Bursaphelenchus okinawaensis]CAG9123203.1 unnamed protein product [Bursaphelenchus okinawaensis]
MTWQLDKYVLFHPFVCALTTSVTLIGLWDIFFATYEDFLISIFCLIIVVEVLVGGAITLFLKKDSQSRDTVTFYLGPLLICSAVINLTSSTVMVFFVYKMNNDPHSLLEIVKLGYGSPWYNKVTEAWDRLHISNECCGVYGYKDWRETDWYKHQNTYPPLRAPASCYNNVIGCHLPISFQTAVMGTLFSTVTFISTIIKIRSFKNILYESNQRVRLEFDNLTV